MNDIFRAAVEDFGRLVGVPVRFDGSVAAYDFSESGRLSFTPTERDEIIVTLSYPVASVRAVVGRLLLEAGYDPSGRSVLQAAVSPDDRIVLAVRRPLAGLNAQSLVETFEFLRAKKRATA